MLTHLSPLHLRTLAEVNPEIAQAIADETTRQNHGLELIASENFASAAVMAAAGSVLTNKYAEGYPGKRYYGGCEFVDVVETLAIERAKELFGAEHANVQPHSGAQANMAVMLSSCKPGDTILGMNLAHGGHLTHGHPLNFSGKFYKVVPYGVRQDDERIDYDELERLAHEHKPKLIVAGASAYPRVIDFARIAAVAEDVGARMLADMAHIAGLVAGGLHPSPVPHAIRHHHDAQDPARPARRLDPLPSRSAPRTSTGGVPGHAGRAADARHRGQGRVLRRGAGAGVQRLSAPGGRQRHAPRAGARGGRLPPRQRRHRQPPDARRRVLQAASPARRPRTRSTTPASPSTRTRSPSTRTADGRLAASASARPRSRRAAWARRRWIASPT